jgi:hypothetical protein
MARESGNHKGRTSSTYQQKAANIRKWYEHIVKNRQETDILGKPKKELRPLEYFIDKVKGPTKA